MTTAAGTPDELVVSIRQMTSRDVSSVAALHRTSLPEDFLPRLGERFLSQVYYPEALRSRWSTVLVAERDGRIVGFLQLSGAPVRFYRELLRRRFLSVAGTALMRLVWNLPLALEALAIVRTLPPHLDSSSEVMFIAVAPEARQQAVGHRLLKETFALCCSMWGVRRLYGKISPSNPGAVALFINRTGGREVSTVVIRRRSYIYVVWEL
jgi:ribosomal protein S18 acetylase RimI-like enzyme